MVEALWGRCTFEQRAATKLEQEEKVTEEEEDEEVPKPKDVDRADHHPHPSTILIY